MNWFRLRGGAQAGYLPWWERLRYWAIRKLTGPRMILINVNVVNGAVMPKPQAMIWNCSGLAINVPPDLHRKLYDNNPYKIIEEG